MSARATTRSGINKLKCEVSFHSPALRLRKRISWASQPLLTGNLASTEGDLNLKTLSRTFVVALAIVTGPAARAAESPSLTLIIENDSFIHYSDKHYTNGFLLSWTSAPSGGGGTMQDVAQNIFLPADGPAQFRYGFSLGQNIYTPTDTARLNPDPLDRPYAGWLYLKTNLTRDTGSTLDQASLSLGVVGPAALGKEVQNGWHALTQGLLGGAKTRGWAFQLDNEPALQFTEQRTWRVPLFSDGLEAEFLPEVTGALGNVFTYAGAGGAFRIGQRLGADWGPPRIQPALSGTDYVNHDALAGHDFGWYFFAGVEGRAMGRNIFLDGSTFESSRSVDKKIFVGDFNAGAALVFDWGRIAATYTNRTPEFTTQRGDDQFVSVGLSFAL